MPHKFSEQYDLQGGDIVASGSASGSAGSFDLTGYDSAVYILSVHCETSGSVAFVPQESATSGGTYTTVAASSGSVALPTIDTSTDDEVYILEVPVSSDKPFQKLAYAQTGANSTITITVLGEGGGGLNALPASQENTIGKW